jgi:uncharacterized protein YeaO (DUF488 family)
MMGQVRTKRIYEPPCRSDGLRVLVDRIWPRGVSRDAAALDEWEKEIAPTTALRKWFGHDPARWEEFQKRYRRELDNNPEAVARLCGSLHQGSVTLLYAARDTQHNHALVLADYLKEADLGNAGRQTQAPKGSTG